MQTEGVMMREGAQDGKGEETVDKKERKEEKKKGKNSMSKTILSPQADPIENVSWTWKSRSCRIAT